MFKRVGATILTIVMLLSMASVFASAQSAPMSLTVELVNGENKPVSTVAPGDAVKAIVKIKNPVAISGMAVVGSYDADLFAPDGEPEVQSYTIGETKLKGMAEESAEGYILAAWVADENVTPEDGATLITVPLTVKEGATLGDADIAFSFKADEMYVKAEGAPASLPNAYYSAESAKETVTIANTYLEVVAPAETKVDKTITVTVKVKGYEKNWAAMTIVGSYNDDVLELDKDATVFGNFKNSAVADEPVFLAKNGTIAATWINENVVDNVDAEFDALTLTFKVKALGDADLSFSFKEDGIAGANNASITEGFSKAPATKPIAINPPVALEVEVKAPEEVSEGDTITVKVNVKNYTDAWSTMTIKGTYDADKLELKTVDPIDFSNGGITEHPVVVKDAGKLAVTWINDGAVDMNDEFTALTLTFEAKGEGVADLSFFFDPDGIKDGDGKAVSTQDFEADRKEETIEIVSSDPRTHLSVKVDEDSAKVGQTVTVEVDVKNYKDNWAAMTIMGTYDAQKFVLKDITPVDFTDGGITEDPIKVIDNGGLAVTWINDDAVVKGPRFTALKLTFEVLSQGDDSTGEFEFFFKPDGIRDADGKEFSDDSFAPEKESDTVTLLPRDAEDTETTLDVSVSSDRAMIGDKITFTVNVQDYLNNWLGMAISANYEQAKLKYIGTTKPVAGFATFNAPSADETGTINVTWKNDDLVALGKNFEAMEMVFEVVGEGDTEVSFEFKPDGIITKDPGTGNEIPAPEGSYSKDSVSKTIRLFTVPFLKIDGDSAVNVDEEYTVELSLKDYNDQWSSFGAELIYDTTKFAIEDAAKVIANAFGGNAPVVDTSVPGKILLTWNESANIDADKVNTILRVTFKAIATGDNVEFNANLVDVKTFDGNANVAVDAGEYTAAAEALSVNILEIKVPYLTLAVEPGNALEERADGVLKLYLNDYTGNWNVIPAVLYFDSDLIRIKEGDIVCNPLGGVEGNVVLRSADDKIVFTWMSTNNIAADSDKIELATIPFKTYQEGKVTFGAEFVADSIKTSNGQGGFDAVDSSTFVPKAEDQTVTIEDTYPNTDPMFLSVDTDGEATKNKKQALTLTINNFNSGVQALSVKLFYDKNKVSISEEDIDPFEDSANNVTGVATINEEEGYIHLTVIAPESISAEETLNLLNLSYTPKVEGQIAFYAEVDVMADSNEKPMDPIWGYEERSETVNVNVKAAPWMSATANKTDVKIGNTVTVTVFVNDYQNAWNAMAINGSYNKDLLQLVSITQTNAFNAANKNLVRDDEAGTFKATWSDTVNVAANKKFEAIILIFKVIDCGDGTAAFNFAFEDILTNGASSLIPDADYIVNAEQVEINIENCDHIWSDSIVHKEGTSGEASKHILTCTKGCGVVKEVACSISATNGDPTCDKPGTITYNCSICGYNETVDNPDVPALGHKFDGKPAHKAGTEKHIYTCSVCGDTKEENCSFRELVVERDCMNDGYTLNTCTVCGYSYKSNIVKSEGKHGALVLHYIAPTATTNGSIITQCDTCRQYVTPPYAGAVKKTLKAGHPFPDVQEPTSWYYDAVKFSKAFDIFGGDEKGNFNPDANITRGQLVTVLGRIMMAEAEKTMSNAQFNAFLKAQTSKVSGMKSASGFTDLDGKYYERYAKLFAKWGIVNGYPDGTFGGDKNITREEMATLIKRFIEAYQGSTENVKFGNAATFKDFSKVSGWAKSNVEWVGKVGLFQGDTEKNYNPQSNATRAEIAVVIERMLPVLKNICACGKTH